MENKKTKSSTIELKALIVLSALFVGVILGAWTYSLKIQDAYTGKKTPTHNLDVKALIEVEKMRNVADSQINKSLSFFLLGSSTLFDEQKADRQTFINLRENFEKQHSLPQVPEILKKVAALEQQQQEYFDQAMEFRAKQTESKIVGQFYRSKTNSIASQISKALDEIVVLHNAEFERNRAEAIEAANDNQVLIPRAMTWFISALTLLFIGMALIIIRMVNQRARQLAERSRLYEETKKAVQIRDEVLAAVSQDLKDPLHTITQAAAGLTGTSETSKIYDNAEVIKSSVDVIEGLVKDILDQTKSDTGTMTLRLDQLPVDVVLDDARLMLQPLAKQRDIRLEFNSVNPPALAFMDRERVMRVLSNLVGNAIKFSPKNSKVIVKVRSDQQFVFISVKDSGPGIPEKQLSEIFDHFWQARKTAAQGPGIGLAIVKTIIEAHGGSVHVESHVGHGSTFTFSLPRRRPVGAHIGRPAASTVRVNPRAAGYPEVRSEGPHA